MDNTKCGRISLIYDEACLVIENLSSQILTVLNCKPQELVTLDPNSTSTHIISTVYPTVLTFQGTFNSSLEFLFKQHGHYLANVTSKDPVIIYQTVPHDDAYSALKDAAWLLAVILMLWALSAFVYNYTKIYSWVHPPNIIIQDAGDDIDVIRSGSSSPLIAPDHTGSRESISQRRTKSLDVFRGITITFMIFVESGGGKYQIFHHAPWNGLTMADIIFPWFAWIMGISLSLSINSQLRNSVERKTIFLKVLKRSLILIVLGIMLNSFHCNDLKKLRIPGVLQRLGLSYIIVAACECWFFKLPNTYNLTGRSQLITEFIYGYRQWLIALSLVVIHTVVTFAVKVPGCPLGYIGPGGLHLNETVSNCTGGISGYIDRIVLKNHIYNHPTCEKVYHCKIQYDPEGLLGTLNTAFTIFLGVHAGRILLSYQTTKQRCIRWLIMAVISGSIVLHLTSCSKEEGIIPLNKNLWSLSFILATTSMAYFSIIIIYLMVDSKKWWSGVPFVQVGKNSILIYIASEMTRHTLPWSFTPLSHYDHHGFLFMNMWSTFLWVLIAIILDKKNIFLSI